MASDSTRPADEGGGADDLLARSRSPGFTPVPRVKPGADGRTCALPGTPHEKAPDPDLGHSVIDQRRYTSAEFMAPGMGTDVDQGVAAGGPHVRHGKTR